MSPGWLIILVIVSPVNDWPWLIGILGLLWVFPAGQAPVAGWSGLFVILGVLGTELVLAMLRPSKERRSEFTVVGLEGACLSLFALLVGPLVGPLFWQLALGFDATRRLGQLMKTLRRTVWLRATRVVAGIALVVLYSHGL